MSDQFERVVRNKKASRPNRRTAEDRPPVEARPPVEDRPFVKFVKSGDGPLVTQVINFAKDHELVAYGKKNKCSPRKLVIHILRHLTEPYGYRWRVVEDNRYAFDIVDLAWQQGDKPIYPTLGRVFVCPL